MEGESLITHKIENNFDNLTTNTTTKLYSFSFETMCSTFQKLVFPDDTYVHWHTAMKQTPELKIEDVTYKDKAFQCVQICSSTLWCPVDAQSLLSVASFTAFTLEKRNQGHCCHKILPHISRKCLQAMKLLDWFYERWKRTLWWWEKISFFGATIHINHYIYHLNCKFEVWRWDIRVPQRFLTANLISRKFKKRCLWQQITSLSLQRHQHMVAMICSAIVLALIKTMMIRSSHLKHIWYLQICLFNQICIIQCTNQPLAHKLSSTPYLCFLGFKQARHDNSTWE